MKDCAQQPNISVMTQTTSKIFLKTDSLKMQSDDFSNVEKETLSFMQKENAKKVYKLYLYNY